MINENNAEEARTNETRDRIRKYGDLLIYAFAVTATVNFITEKFGRFREEFFYFCILALLFRVIFSDKRCRKLVVYCVAFLIVFPFLTRCSAFLWLRGNEDAKFDVRVATLLAGNLRLYENRFLPAGAYGAVKSKVKRVFVPELRDTEHRYESIDIEVAQMGDDGVTSYTYKGDTYGGKPIPLTFSCCGEARVVNRDMNIRAWALPDTVPIDLKDEQLEQHGDNFLYAAKIPLDSVGLEFEVIRVAHVKKVMGNAREGFILDLRNIIHPPRSFRVKLVYDRGLEHLDVWRIRRIRQIHRRFFNWMFLQPIYTRESLAGNTKTILYSEAEIEADRNFIRKRKRDANATILEAGWELPSSGDSELNVYVVSYHVN